MAKKKPRGGNRDVQLTEFDVRRGRMVPKAKRDAIYEQYFGEPQNRAERRQQAPRHKVVGKFKAPARGSITRVQLKDGTIGYHGDALRGDDCFRGAIATTIQVPMDEIPDLQLDAHVAAGFLRADELNLQGWLVLVRWLQETQGLMLTFHMDALPFDRDRWIGVVKAPPRPGDPLFADHCIVMNHDRTLFDPAANATLPLGMRLADFKSADIAYGLTFDDPANSKKEQ